MVTVVTNPVLTLWYQMREQSLCVWTTNEKSILKVVMDVFINLTKIIISQSMHIPNPHITEH